jgi:hypothetical protein
VRAQAEKGEVKMLQRFHEVWRYELLPQQYHEAVLTAVIVLIDDYLDNTEEEEPLMVYGLPPRYKPRYDHLFRKKFFMCVANIGYQLLNPDRHNGLASCVAEELAVHIILEQAKTELEIREIDFEPDVFEEWEEHVLKDRDYEYLYDNRFDGIEDAPEVAHMAISNLRFEDWFKPFENRVVHPYAWDDPNEEKS